MFSAPEGDRVKVPIPFFNADNKMAPNVTFSPAIFANKRAGHVLRQKLLAPRPKRQPFVCKRVHRSDAACDRCKDCRREFRSLYVRKHPELINRKKEADALHNAMYWAGWLDWDNDDIIPVKAATSVKQRKVRAIKHDSAPVWTDAELAAREVSIPRKPFRQERFGLLLSAITKPKVIGLGCAGQDGLLQIAKPKTLDGLVEGLMRGYAIHLERKHPGFMEALQEYCDEEKKKTQQPDEPVATPNMDSVRGDDPNLTPSTAGNVSLLNPKEEQKMAEPVKVGLGFLPSSSATETQTFSQIMERWIKYDVDLEWKTTQPVGTTICDLRLPYDLMSVNLNSPNVLPLLVHKYGRFGMKIKIIVNSNRFQQGQLQASWMYLAHLNAFQDRYDNVYSASQRRHAIISAGASNWVELDVPYWALTSALNLKLNASEAEQRLSAMILGKFSLRVLSPLVVGENAYKLAHVTIMMMFTDVELRGLCDKSLHSPFRVAEPNMEEITNTMESALKLIKPALNLDNPTKPALPALIQPYAAQPFGTVKGQNELIRPLRADPLATTPGVVAGEGDYSLRDLLSRWSLLTNFAWKSDDSIGVKLWDMPAMPALDYSYYAQNTTDGTITVAMPIIAVLSRLFTYWRGDIELRFDFVATQFHSGSIMIATVPGGEGNELASQAKNSANVIFSLLDTHQAVYRIPYYSNLPFNPIYGGVNNGRSVVAPSFVTVFVVNPLVPMDSISKSIDVLVYIRAADNFELALLSPPSIGLSLNAKVRTPTSSSAWVDPNWAYMFTASSWRFPAADGGYYLSFFESETTDYFTQFLNLDFKKVYKVPDSTAKVTIGTVECWFKCEYYESKNVLKEVKYMVRAMEYPAYPVVVLFDTAEHAWAYAKDHSKHQGQLKAYAQGPWAQIKRDEHSSWVNISWTTLPYVPFVMLPEPRQDDDFEIIARPNMEPIRGEVIQAIALDQPASCTMVGASIFGENITSIKEITRRWQYLGCGSIREDKSMNTTCINEMGYCCRIQTKPVRSFSVNSSWSRDNRCREGVISLLASGFAGYRGSIRYKIVVSSRNWLGLNFVVVHKFNHPPNVSTDSVVVREMPIRSKDDFCDTAYAAQLQSTWVNNVLEFEVPFYNRGEYNSLYIVRGDKSFEANNFQQSGVVYVYTNGLDATQSVSFDVYYSLGDDFIFSNFQGFPLMIDVSGLPAEPNMDIIKGFFVMPKKLSRVCDVLSESATKVTSVVSNVASSLQKALSQIVCAPFVKKGVNSFASIIGACSGFAHLVITQLMHILAAPSSKMTVAIALTSVLCVLFSDKISQIFDKLKSCISACWNWLFGEHQQNGVGTTTATPNDDNQAVFVSLLWSIVAMIAGYIGSAPKNLSMFVKGLFSKSSEMFRTHVFGVKFFKDFLELIQRFWRWINVKIGKSKPLYTLCPDDKFLTEWFIASSVLLAPENEELIGTSKQWISKLFEYQVIGRLLNQAAINTADHISPHLRKGIETNQAQLTKLTQRLIKQKCYIPIRQEPFICWIWGEAGLGKTHNAQHLMRFLACDYKIDPSIFCLVSGQKYFDLLQHQKFVLLDDFMNWTGDSMNEILGQFLQMAGSSMLSLPRAVAEDKITMDNFEFLFITANQQDFSGMTQIREPDAFNRRRHCTIKVQLTSEYVKGFPTRKAALSAWRAQTAAEKANSTDVEYIFFNGSDCPSGAGICLKSRTEVYRHLKLLADQQRAQAFVTYKQAIEEHSKALSNSVEGASSFQDFFNKMKEIASETPTTGCQEAVKGGLDWIIKNLESKYVVHEQEVLGKSQAKPYEDFSESVKNLDDKPGPSAEPNMMSGSVSDTYREDAMYYANDPKRPTIGDPKPNGLIRYVDESCADFQIRCLMYDSYVTAADRYLTEAICEEQFIAPNQSITLPPLYMPIDPITKLPSVDLHRSHPFCAPHPQDGGCAHKSFDFSSAKYYRFNQNGSNSVNIFKEYPVHGIFLDMKGLISDFKYQKRTEDEPLGKSFACFSGPCLDASGIVSGCTWMQNMDLYMTRYWSSLLSVLKAMGLTWSDFRKMTEEERSSFIPPQLWTMLKPFYEKDSELQSDVGLLQKFMGYVTFGFCADRCQVAGVSHGIYPDKLELLSRLRHNEKKIIDVDKGWLYNTVRSETTSGIVEEKELTRLSKAIITVGVAIAGLASLCAFLDIIFYFLEYWGFWSLWKYNTATQPNMSTSGASVTPKAKSGSSAVKALKLLQQTDNGISEGTQDMLDKITAKISSNVFFIIARNKGLYKRARCLGLCSYYGLVLTHYIESFAQLKLEDPAWEFYMHYKGVESPFQFDSVTIMDTNGGGYSVMKFPRNGFQFKNIVKYMPTEAQYKSFPSAATLVEVFPDKTIMHQLDIEYSARQQYVAAPPDSGMSDWTISQKFQYGLGGNGLCGSFLIGKTTTSMCLLGIHTAGVGSALGFSELLLQETFAELHPEDTIEMVNPQMSLVEGHYKPEGDHIPVGHLDAKMKVIVPSKTKIIKSEVYGILPANTEPAPLCSDDPRLEVAVDPLHVGVEKRCDLVKEFNSIDIENIEKDLTRRLICKAKPVRAKVDILTYEEAVEGLPIRGMEPMELSTSEGYPWVKMRPPTADSKRWLFEMDNTSERPKCIKLNPVLRETLEMKRKMRERRVAPATYFTACLKDARIAKEKCRIPGKTRVFEMSPVDYTIAQRQHFLDFYAAYMTHRRYCENSIGINVNGKEWSLLATDMLSFSKFFLAGDYSSYGPRMNLTILHAAWRVKVKWMLHHLQKSKSEDELRVLKNTLEVLGVEGLNSLLVVRDYVMRCKGGMHSGNSATVILNSLCNSFLIRLAYLAIMRKAGRLLCATLQKFNELVRLVSNGDDVLIAVHPSIIEDFNNVELSNFFAKYGLRYTNTAKTGDIKPFETINEIQYLKCNFVPHPFRKGEWLAPLSKESIEDCPQWIWKSDIDVWEATLQNCEQAVRLAYGHGREYYNKFSALLLNYLLARGKYVTFLTWTEMDKLVWESTEPLWMWSK